MNPEQPSREQIEARITAMLLGELPAAEAELLHWTISQDPELQKLHDQLKLTIGFVREAMKNPAGAPPERDTPMKLRQERRQTLLAHFKTARPQPQLPEPSQPPQKLSWLRPIEVIKASPVIAALAVIAIVAVLAAISIPNFVKARATSQENACINNLRQIDAAKNEWALETHRPADAVPTVKDLTPYLQGNEIRPVAGEHYTLGKVSEPTVADFNGKRLTAAPENFASAATDQSVASNRRQNNAAAFSDSKVTTIAGRQTTRSPAANSGAAAVTPTPAPIALPNTELSQTTSEQSPGVFSQNVVGYVNVTPGASSTGYSHKPKQEETKTESTFAFKSASSQSEASTSSPFVGRLQYRLPGTEPAPTAEMPSAPPPKITVGGVTTIPGPAEAQIPPTPAGGNYTVSAPTSPLPNIEPVLPDSIRDKNMEVNGALSDNKKFANGPIENGVFQNGMQNGQVYARNGTTWETRTFICPPDSSSNFATNFAMLGDRNPGFGGFADSGVNQTANSRPVQNFNFPDQSLSNFATNGIALDGDRNLGLADGAKDQSVYAYNLHNADPNEVAAELRKMFSASSRGIDNSVLAKRESQNARTVSDSPAPTTTSVPPTGIAGSETVARTLLPPRLQRQYEQKSSDSRGKSQITVTPIPASPAEAIAESGLATAASAPPPEQSPPAMTLGPLPARESQNANTDVPVVGEVPITGRLFTAPAVPPLPQPQPSNVDTVKNQYAEGKKDNISDKDLLAQTPTPILSTEQIQSLNEKLVEQKALAMKLEKEVSEFQAIQATNPTDRGAGIVYGLQAQLAATEAQVAGFTNQLHEFGQESQDELNRGQDYWIARAQLQNKEDLHKLLGEKIEADEADAQLPKSSLVTIVNPAQSGQSQNLWQRMTGTVESKAQIEIQPDVTSATPIEYAAYDPYFMETEVNTLKGDVVLGTVVDSLKLDQAWSKQGDGEILSRKDAIARLRSQLDLESDRNTKLIDIGVKSEKPDEAAKIANAVAEAYKQYRLEVHSNEMASGIGRLKQRYAEEDREIRQLQTTVQQKEPQAPAGEPDRPLPRPPANAPVPQPEIQTLDNAFSTFSMNVSDVSFKLAMASLQKGRMPDPASIRSEEFINAFDYHDPEPLQGEPLAFVSERAADPFAQERDVLRFSIKAAAAGRQNGRALNLVLLLDTSGSMERSDRVAIIREALRVLSAQLQPQDVVSVVTFARTARLWADGIPGNQAAETLDKVGSITPEGGTNLEEAMRLAYETALRHFIAGGMNRVVMLTDGAANLGEVDPKTLTQKVDWERRQGIALDCFGIGWDDYNDDLLEQLSSNGDGRYAFINSPDEAATEFAAKLAGALQVAAEDVKVQVEFNPSRVTAWRQIGYAKHQLTKEQFRDNTVAAGAIAAREAGNALYVIETKPDGEGPIATVHVRYRVPGTQDVREHSWAVDYTGAAPELTEAGPAMRLAVTAAEISEWLAGSPFAQEVTPDELLNYLSGVPQFYGTDDRPKQLETMIREAKSVSGK